MKGERRIARGTPKPQSAASAAAAPQGVLGTRPPPAPPAAPKDESQKLLKNKVDSGDRRSTDSSAGVPIAELGELLALGLLRLSARNSRGKPAQGGESSLDISAAQSGHQTPAMRGGLDG